MVSSSGDGGCRPQAGQDQSAGRSSRRVKDDIFRQRTIARALTFSRVRRGGTPNTTERKPVPRIDRPQGPGMKPESKSKFAEYADQCLRLAEAADSPKEKALLLHMAQAWRRLSDQAEHIAALVDEARSGRRGTK
jgi:hypothetical protein